MTLSYQRLTLRVPVRGLLWLRRRLRYVRAAGGMVTAPDGRRLLIRREGHWDLPKGMVETGEPLAAAALREVEEETGIRATLLGHRPVKTYHLYHRYGGWHLKQTAWFRMAAPPLAGRPQQEEGITEALWLDADEWRRRLRSSYGTLRSLVRRTDI